MKTYFMNNGDFDIRAMLTMGVSAKTGSDAIGFFGTGFKYAVAIILRGGGKIKISTISGVYEFTAKTETIRDKEFQIVYCNSKEAGFTTHMGINWKPWMAFRELYCNAKDEGGRTDSVMSQDWDTIIEVESADIAECYRGRADYFLEGTPLHEDRNADIHEGGKPYIYYRGIAVKDAYPDQMYTYNIKSVVGLTEDRTARYEHEIQWPMQKAIQNMDNAAMLRQVLRNGSHAEAKLQFDSCWGVSDTFIDVCQELMRTDAGVCEPARVMVGKIRDRKGDWPEFQLNSVQSKMLDRAISTLGRIDVNVRMYPIKTVIGLGDGVMGRALDGVIYLSELPFQMGTKQLASTLLEEWVHNKTGAADFDRVMQTWLFDKILSLSESITGEPI